MLFMLCICFIFILLIVIIIRFGTSIETKRICVSQKKNFTDLYDLENGDLVFVSYKNVFGKVVQVWSGSKWTHIGMIFKNPDNGTLSVLEAAEYNNPNFNKGIIEVPLKSWLQMNEDFEIGYKKINKKISSYELYDIFEKYQGKKLYKLSPNPTKLKTFIFSRKINETEEEMTCVEFITCMLKDLNILPTSASDITTVSDILSYFTVDKDAKEGNTGIFTPIGKLT
jgi:hypothetical protein